MRTQRMWQKTGIVAFLLIFLLSACSKPATPPAGEPQSGAQGNQAASVARSDQQTAADQSPQPGEPAKPITEYTIPATSDYSGPYADLFPMIDAGRNACLDSWNEHTGKDLGVRLKLETFDSRYDPSIIASTYPRMVSQYQPIAWLGWGGSDVAALMQRLPQDKVPMLLSVGAYGMIWRPQTWIVTLRPTAAHEYVAFQDWVLSQWQESRPYRMGGFAFESPVVADALKGLDQAYADLFAGRAVFGPTEYGEPVPVDASSQARRLLDGGVDGIMIATTTAQVVAMLNGMEQVGKQVPLVLTSHNGLGAIAKVIGGYDRLEGSYEVYGLAPAYKQDIPAVTDAWAHYGGGKPWDMDAAQGCGQTLLLGAAVRRAAEQYGSADLTGEKVYSVFANTTISSAEMLGLTPDLEYDHEKPFPQSKVWISTVKGGRLTAAVLDWWAVPELNKW